MKLLDRLIKKLQNTNIHYIGDSHVQVFEHINISSKKISPKFCIVQGATASGLKNPHSKTQSGPIMDHYINDKLRKKDWAVFHLGEVDCGFLLWVKSERDNEDINMLLSRALNNYFQLILRASKIVGTKIVVLSVVLPTIKDGQTFGNIANLRGHIKATQQERTALTLQMSAEIKKFCLKHHFCFLDLYPAIYNPETKIINEKFLNENPEDHHLSNQQAQKVISPLLNAIISKETT